jgi:hypothetical protein
MSAAEEASVPWGWIAAVIVMVIAFFIALFAGRTLAAIVIAILVVPALGLLGWSFYADMQRNRSAR